jgi:hypothetical protein
VTEKLTTGTFPIHVFSRSSIEQDWRCPRERYWNTVAINGRGLQSKGDSFYLQFGIIFHQAMEDLALGKHLEPTVEIAKGTLSEWFLTHTAPLSSDPEWISMEQCSLMEGLIRGSAQIVFPAIKARGQIVAVEREVAFIDGGLGMLTTPDIVVKCEDGTFEYHDHKTTQSKQETWFEQWDTSIQSMATVKAVEQTLGARIERVVYHGYYKGWNGDGWQHSPFCWGWKKDGLAPFQEEEYSYTVMRTKGWFRSPVWEMDGGVKRWMEDMPSDLLSKQFFSTPPLYVNDDLISSFMRQTWRREWAIAGARENIRNNPDKREEIMDEVFPQVFKNCPKCWAKDLCHQPAVSASPLTKGFALREFHHPLEEEWWTAWAHSSTI